MNILITGAASGIGRAATERFLRQGHRVYGVDISPLDEREGFWGFTADVTDAQALTAVKETLEKQEVSLDVIVNIAGVHTMASLVEADYPSMKKVIDINLCGAVLVNRTFHGLLKKDGRIVIVTSEVAPLAPMPFNGLYNVTKTALDSYAQALRQELNLLGQRVITVRPGAVQTPLSVGSMQATEKLANQTVLYQKQAKSFCGLAAKFMGTPVSPEAIAMLIERATTAKRPRMIYQKNRHLGLLLLNILPKRLQCAIIKFLLNM